MATNVKIKKVLCNTKYIIYTKSNLFVCMIQIFLYDSQRFNLSQFIVFEKSILRYLQN